MIYHHLYHWGLSEHFAHEAQKYEQLSLGRVTEQHHNIYKIICETGVEEAQVSGKFIYDASDNSAFPAVGDWVMVRPASGRSIIHHILPRKSVFGRKAAGQSHETQIVATNIDTAFICMALNADFNLRRLERYLATAWDSGAIPAIILTKSDLCDNLSARLVEVTDIAAGVKTIVCTNTSADGYKEVAALIEEGKTAAFIGSSGIGKSTIINALAGEALLQTNEIREDGKGRHTTTHRQLIALPGHGVVIDTPGMRELGLENADMEKSFSDIESLAEKCKFRDCSHTAEPGCAIRAAIETGALDAKRFENYKKIQTEIGYAGLSSRQVEEEKINRMFGGKKQMKTMIKTVKIKNQQ